jgi:hypothetical protein
MAYKITVVNTKQTENHVDFSTWLESQDSSILSGFPEYAGMSPSQVVSNFTNDLNSKQMTVGLVSEESTESEDGLTFTLVQIWESYDDYVKSQNGNAYLGNISCNTSSNTVTSHENVFFNRLDYLEPGSLIRKINMDNWDTDTWMNIGTVSSIDSTSSLTLTLNAEINVVNEQAVCFKVENDVLTYLQTLYQTEYPFTTTVTEGNV